MNYKIYVRNIAIFLSLLVISLPFVIAEENNLVYDSNGNLVTGDSFYREYNEFNQLTRIRSGNTSSGQVLEEFVWHPVEERILIKDVFYKGIKNYTVYYVSQEYLVIENKTGNYTEKYVYQDGTLVAQVNTNGNKEFIHSDYESTSSLITDNNGNVVENSFFDPYGSIIEGGKTSRLDYEAKETDTATNEIDFHFRFYNPNRIKFNQPDDQFDFLYNPQKLNR